MREICRVPAVLASAQFAPAAALRFPFAMPTRCPILAP
jgi:hypothetical protein